DAQLGRALGVGHDLLDRAAQETRVSDDLADVREELDPGAGDDLLDRLDQRAADQVVRLDLGGHAGGVQGVLVGLRDDLEIADVPVGTDLVHEPRELLARKPHVLAADVAHARVGDGGIDLTRILERDVVAGQHEDELDHRSSPKELSDNWYATTVPRARSTE